jgi:chemotaxis protein histidine kinase CheA
MNAEVAAAEEDEVIIFEPDFSLKQKIGNDVSITELLRPDVLLQAQFIVDQQRPAFIASMKEDVRRIRELLVELENTAWDAAVLEQFMQLVLQVKGRAGTFGLPLASEVARRLYVFCEDEYRAKADHMLVVRKHVEGIAVVVNQNIEGSGGAIGQELLESLTQLAKKLK